MGADKMKRIARMMLIVISSGLLCSCNRQIQAVKEDTKSSKEPVVTAAVTQESSNEAEEQFKEKWTKAIESLKSQTNFSRGADVNISKEEREAQFDALIEEVNNGLDDEEIIYYRLREIIASMKHVHMGLYYSEGAEAFDNKVFGLFFMKMHEGLMLIGADKQYEAYLGNAVTAINGYSLDEMKEKYTRINCSETEVGRENWSNYLCTSELAYLGVMDKGEDAIELTLKDLEGNEKKVTIKASKQDEVQWQYLIPEKGIPFSVENTGENYTYIEDEAHGIMYFQYTACAENETQPFEAFFNEMMTKMKEKDDIYKYFIIDVRYNYGGNRYLLRNKLQQYKEELAKKKIYMIIGSGTTSAAVQAIEDCMTFFDEVTLYGTPTNGAIDNYTEISSFLVPNTHLVYIGTTAKDVLPKLVEKYGDIKDSVTPDVPVTLSFNDYMDGVDTIYQKIIDDISGEK